MDGWLSNPNRNALDPKRTMDIWTAARRSMGFFGAGVQSQMEPLGGSPLSIPLTPNDAFGSKSDIRRPGWFRESGPELPPGFADRPRCKTAARD